MIRTNDNTKTILVVDDDEIVRRTAVAILNQLGYSTLEAKDGPSAPQLLPSLERATQVSKSAGTKERIEREAQRLFVEQGIAETSIRDIARAAGISQGAMYNHYASKEELARTLFLRSFAEAESALEVRAKSEEGVAAKLRAMVRYIYSRFDADPVAVAYIFLARQQYLRSLPEGFPHP